MYICVLKRKYMSELSKTGFNEKYHPNKNWRSIDTCRTGPVPGLFRLTEGCQCPNHYPAAVDIPPGMAYRHICFTCKAEVVIIPQSSARILQYPLTPDEMINA